MGITGPGSSKAFLPEKYLLNSVDFITASKSDFQQTLNQLAEEINSKPENIQYNWVYLDALGISYDESSSQDQASGFSFMTVASILVGCLVLLAAGLVIYNILKIAVSKRIREYGCLRAIGAAPGSALSSGNGTACATMRYRYSARCDRRRLLVRRNY